MRIELEITNYGEAEQKIKEMVTAIEIVKRLAYDLSLLGIKVTLDGGKVTPNE